MADEAQLLVPKILHKIVVTESWSATEFATRLRKRGCGFLLITQSPSNIEKDILKNVGTKIAFRLQHQEDIKLMAEAAGFMDYTEYEFLSDRFVRLPRKSAIVITSGLCYVFSIRRRTSKCFWFIAQKTWYERHIAFENIKKGFNERDFGKHGTKIVDKIAKELVREGMIITKPTHYGMQISLNPRQSDRIIAIMKTYFPEV